MPVDVDPDGPRADFIVSGGLQGPPEGRFHHAAQDKIHQDQHHEDQIVKADLGVEFKAEQGRRRDAHQPHGAAGNSRPIGDHRLEQLQKGQCDEPQKVCRNPQAGHRKQKSEDGRRNARDEKAGDKGQVGMQGQQCRDIGAHTVKSGVSHIQHAAITQDDHIPHAQDGIEHDINHHREDKAMLDDDGRRHQQHQTDDQNRPFSGVYSFFQRCKCHTFTAFFFPNRP